MQKIIAIMGLALLSVYATGQENNNFDAQGKTVRGPYETNRFFDNVFIQGGVGSSVYLGGQNGGGFGNRVRPTYDLGVGKWFTPSIGARLQFNYSPTMREYSATYVSPFGAFGINDAGQRLQKFNFMNIHGDFMWNLSSAIGGYKESRVYEVIPYVGVGYGRIWREGVAPSEQITANVGIINKFRVSRSVDINIELRSAIINGQFDRSTISNKVDIPVAATVGFTYRFGKIKGFKRVTPPVVADYRPFRTRIKALEDDNASLGSKNKILVQENETLRNTEPKVVTVSKEDIEMSPVALFFTLGKATLDKKELTNLGFYVEYAIKVDPNKVFTLIGSADKATGNAQINKRLSEQRVQYVYDLLVNKYNIPASRLVKKAVGDEGNRFQDPELNRTVIIE